MSDDPNAAEREKVNRVLAHLERLSKIRFNVTTRDFGWIVCVGLFGDGARNAVEIPEEVLLALEDEKAEEYEARKAFALLLRWYADWLEKAE